MSARRQPSTTSLSKFATGQTFEFANRSLDFCNAFWGLGDGGVDVLFARMRGAIRTIDELKNFWRERASIEEQYAKRLSNLAKSTLGKDEIGELRASLDTLRLETDKQASFHMNVANQIKNDLEGPTTQFLAKQHHHKKTYQAAIEKEFKTKQTQEGYVNKAREKYEADCVRINSYTAQSTLMQGKDLEKIQIKLERAQQTVHANERDFASFSRALQDTVAKWEMDWKTFCDSCQDLEEERIDFMKDTMWAYANAVSTVCVSDDESCERMRLALEQLETEKDMENFVRDYGTGNSIPDPPSFVNYANPDAVPPSSQRPITRPAQFVRSSQRQRSAPQPPPEPEEEPINITGVGAGGGRRGDSISDSQTGRARSQSRASTRQGYGQPAYPESSNGHLVNGHSSSSQGMPAGSGSSVSMRAPDPQAEPINPTTTTMLKVGDRAYEVDLTKDPQARNSSVQNGANIGPSKVGQDDDPLARQMEQLRNTAGSSASGSVRRQQQQVQPEPQGSSSRNGTNLSPPPGSRGGGPPNRDYRRSAEIVVGAFPPGVTPSRPTSPRAPTPVMMNAPASQPAVDVQNVLTNYHQSLPGERKSISRPGSRTSFVGQPGQPQNRPLSIEGHAGIGAQGRSTSPQPFASPSRGASPAVQQQPQQPQAGPANRRNSYRAPPPGNAPGPSPTSQRTNSISVPQMPAHQQRPTSPNTVGIALAPDGRVVEDSMADMYKPQQNPQHHHVQRNPSYPPPTQPPYGAPPPAPAGFPPNYVQQAPPAIAPQQQPPIQSQPYIQQRGPDPTQQQVQYQPPAHTYQPQSLVNYGAPNNGMVQRAPSMNAGGYYGNGQIIPQQQQPQQMVGYPQGRAPSPARSPQPQRQSQQQQQQPPPTGQYTEDGRGVLFYVKALYDYQATIEEEFDFQAGDIIAVTDTPEDGWWSGELLDEARRQPGRTVFPSNFVTLF
ncbi:unnamed protein product [Somion occarium]|uniref:Septation protein imp2 n=1 Tax=Somion occarium TaxID=3059160 RepID=A0ABP1DV18_9APHY